MKTMPQQHSPNGTSFYGAVTVGARGQIVVPRRLRDELGIGAGEQLLVLRGAGPGSFLVQRAETLLAALDMEAFAAIPTASTDQVTPVPPPAEPSPEVLRELAASPLFAGLAPAALERVAALAQVRRFEPGAFIVREDEPCRAMYVVRSGLVRRLNTSPEGKEQVLMLLGPGEVFNEAPIVDGGLNPSSAQAVQASEVYEFRCDDIAALMTEHPAVAAGLTRTLAVRLRQLTGVIEDLSFRHVTGRIAHLLLEQADGRLPATRITQQEMAAMAGTAREVAGRAVHALEAAGAVQMDQGRIVIRDRQKLESYL